MNIKRPESIGSQYYNRLGQFFILFMTVFLLSVSYVFSFLFNGSFEVSTGFFLILLFVIILNLLYYRFSDVIVKGDNVEARKLFSVKRKKITDITKVDQMAFPFIGYVQFKDGSRFYSLSSVIDILDVVLKNKPNKMISDFELLKKFHDSDIKANN